MVMSPAATGPTIAVTCVDDSAGVGLSYVGVVDAVDVVGTSVVVVGPSLVVVVADVCVYVYSGLDDVDRVVTGRSVDVVDDMYVVHLHVVAVVSVAVEGAVVAVVEGDGAVVAPVEVAVVVPVVDGLVVAVVIGLEVAVVVALLAIFDVAEEVGVVVAEDIAVVLGVVDWRVVSVALGVVDRRLVAVDVTEEVSLVEVVTSEHSALHPYLLHASLMPSSFAANPPST